MVRAIVLGVMFVFLRGAFGQTTRPVVLPDGDRRMAGVIVYRDVSYGASAAERMDIYLPAGGSGNGSGRKVPLIIWVHGGGWAEGDKAPIPVAGRMRGDFAVASINYRLSDEAKFPAQIFDCKAAVRFMRAHSAQFGVDPARFGVWGASAGGHLAALMGTTNGRAAYEGDVGDCRGTESDVQAVCDWFGPADLGTILPELAAMDPGSPMLKEPTFNTRFLHDTHDQAEVRMASPLYQVTAKSVPMLIVHGGKDTIVPHVQSEAMYAALRAAGVDAELVTLPKAGHGGGDFNKPGEAQRAVSFLLGRMKGGGAGKASSRPG